ncbi:hypothetical protein [Nocardia sp. XZ_19_385]|uniref:hypothetical protein n=1 Tax=Nocardia sp. XZ_19_385 TaxID=2769488 RepID=UPI00188EB386|nr:hypothetical protein [Nocardia sp. XZ_19_385]
MSDTQSFLSAIDDLHEMFSLDRRTAVELFPDALALATDEDRAFLDELVELFTLYPRESVLRRLEARWREADRVGDETVKARLVALVPDSDPGLYQRDRSDAVFVAEQRARRNGTTLEAEHANLTASLLAAEMPRQSIRTWRNPPARLTAAPSREVDKSRMTARQIAARSAARGRRRPAPVEPPIVSTYVAEHLFVDTQAREEAQARARVAELTARGLISEAAARRGWIPRTPGELPPLPADLARQRWEHTYCGYVADQHNRDRALDGSAPIPTEDALDYAGARTQLAEGADRRARIPFQGNARDDFDGAMIPVSGWRCVSCFIERPTADQYLVHSRGGQMLSDDGLCDCCRAADRPGLPALTGRYTARDLARTYCRFYAEHYPSAARALLAEVRRRAPQWLTEIIDQFLTAHPVLPGAPEPVAESAVAATSPQSQSRRRTEPELPEGMRRGRCEGCTEIKPVHNADGFCTQCWVWLELDKAAPRQRRAA